MINPPTESSEHSLTALLNIYDDVNESVLISCSFRKASYEPIHADVQLDSILCSLIQVIVVLSLLSAVQMINSISSLLVDICS